MITQQKQIQQNFSCGCLHRFDLHDGSSRFAKENKWGNFPSVSVGWRFSDEKFMKFSKKFLEDGKIRASFGITGNEAIGNYDYIYSYSPNSIYDGVGGVIPTRIGKDPKRPLTSSAPP